MSSTIKIDGGNGFRDYVKKMLSEKATLKVGFLENAKYPYENIGVVEVAMRNEYGSTHPCSAYYEQRAKAVGIHWIKEGMMLKTPSRPFMEYTFLKNNKQWVKILAKTLPTTNFDMKKSFKILGEVIKGEIQHTISVANSLFQPNDGVTIRIKGKDTVLRDSLQMLHSVAYEVE